MSAEARELLKNAVMKRRLVAVISSIVVLTSACAAEVEDEGADEEVVSQDAAITGRIRAGTELVTTTRVNLREGPSKQEDVIRVLATGTPVKLTTGRSQNGYYEVSSQSGRGWVYGTYMRPSEERGSDDADEEEAATSTPSGSSCFDSSAASRMVSQARRMDGRRSQSLCYRYVKNHIEYASVMNRSRIPAAYQGSAYMFATWARRDPAGFKRAGFARSSANLGSIPPGAVIVWRPGQCGYNARHGHIEVAIGGGRACSDFCGTIRRGCGMPEVFVPIKSSCR